MKLENNLEWKFFIQKNLILFLIFDITFYIEFIKFKVNSNTIVFVHFNWFDTYQPIFFYHMQLIC